MSEPTPDYNRAVLFRAQEFGCDQAEATVWALIAARRGLGEDEADRLDGEVSDYVADRRAGRRSLDDLSGLLAAETG